MSVNIAPAAERMNGGAPPTLLNDRTGELTPPGMTRRARSKAAAERGDDEAVDEFSNMRNKMVRRGGRKCHVAIAHPLTRQ
jgi:hypothetical protein